MLTPHLQDAKPVSEYSALNDVELVIVEANGPCTIESLRDWTKRDWTLRRTIRCGSARASYLQYSRTRPRHDAVWTSPHSDGVALREPGHARCAGRQGRRHAPRQHACRRRD